MGWSIADEGKYLRKAAAFGARHAGVGDGGSGDAHLGTASVTVDGASGLDFHEPLAGGLRKEDDMKKTYEKPVVSKRGKLGAVTAASVTVIWVP